jgi:hypothetical protein
MMADFHDPLEIRDPVWRERKSFRDVKHDKRRKRWLT